MSILQWNYQVFRFPIERLQMTIHHFCLCKLTVVMLQSTSIELASEEGWKKFSHALIHSIYNRIYMCVINQFQRDREIDRQIHPLHTFFVPCAT